nr:MAG TPA: hypothetical protein [Bacteriophage sp.]
MINTDKSFFINFSSKIKGFGLFEKLHNGTR